MFERFTARARRVLVLAQEEARDMQHNFIGTEHILLGLLAEGEGLGAKVLTDLGVGLDACRATVLETIGPGKISDLKAAPPFTPRAKKVLEMALREALQLGHNYIGTEHLLLGLIREGEGVAAQVLVSLGVEVAAARAKVMERLAAFSAGTGAGASTSATPAGQAVGERAAARAGNEPVGSHHLLQGILDVPDSLGARVLASYGLTLEAAKARIEEMGTKGTSDELPRRRRRRGVRLAPGITLTVDDDELEAEGAEPAPSLELSRTELSRIIDILREHLERAVDGDEPDTGDTARAEPPADPPPVEGS